MERNTPNTASPAKRKFDPENFPSNTSATDHMLIAKYSGGKWSDAEIVPYHQLTLSPLAMCLHYGQTVFEGLKAYRSQTGKINIFRLDSHYHRMNKSLKRMAMPELSETMFIKGIEELVKKDEDWVIDEEGFSLYIRPFVIATEAKVGVSVSSEYLFMVVCTPMRAYYSRPLRVKVEKDFIRAAKGGTGAAKNGGNYGGALYPTLLANQEGYDQVLWTDASHKEFLEESGTMNLMFIIDDILITPPAGSTILEGVTRDSILELARERKMEVQVRPLSVKEVEEAFLQNKKVEAFGVGTAAVVAPFEKVRIGKNDYFPYIEADAVMYSLKEELQAIRLGLLPDKYGWNTCIQ